MPTSPNVYSTAPAMSMARFVPPVGSPAACWMICAEYVVGARYAKGRKASGITVIG